MVIPAHSLGIGAQRGASLLEVLITLVILAIGLLGLAGLQSRLQASEMEAYQRAQALVLLEDMASRIAANRANAASYVTDTPLGFNNGCSYGTSTRQTVDFDEWCKALQGAGELQGTASVGAMIGGRGCVEVDPDDPDVYRVTVAWQGLTPLAAPAESCGKDLYDGAAGSVCTGDLCRRVATTVVRIGNLSSL
jgi:type IV pilus assembly protein PilV